jgi:hypothetical protein
MGIGVLRLSEPFPFMREWQGYVFRNPDIKFPAVGVCERGNCSRQLGGLDLFGLQIYEMPFDVGKNFL